MVVLVLDMRVKYEINTKYGQVLHVHVCSHVGFDHLALYPAWCELVLMYIGFTVERNPTSPSQCGHGRLSYPITSRDICKLAHVILMYVVWSPVSYRFVSAGRRVEQEIFQDGDRQNIFGTLVV